MAVIHGRGNPVVGKGENLTHAFFVSPDSMSIYYRAYIATFQCIQIDQPDIHIV